eukprot:tig00000658_g2901.t1
MLSLVPAHRPRAGGRPTGADEAESYPHEPRPPSRDVDHGRPPSSPACVAAAAAAPRPALTTSSTKALGNARRRRLITAARGDEIDPNAAAREAEGRLERTWPNSPQKCLRSRSSSSSSSSDDSYDTDDPSLLRRRPYPVPRGARRRRPHPLPRLELLRRRRGPVPLPFRSSLVSAAGVALSHPSPAAAALAPGAYPDPRAAASALVFLAELAILADYLDARRLELACAALASSASELAIKSAWAKASVRPPPPRGSAPFRLSDLLRDVY